MNTRQHELEYDPNQHYEKDIKELDAMTMSAEPILKQKMSKQNSA